MSLLENGTSTLPFPPGSAAFLAYDADTDRVLALASGIIGGGFASAATSDDGGETWTARVVPEPTPPEGESWVSLEIACLTWWEAQGKFIGFVKAEPTGDGPQFWYCLTTADGVTYTLTDIGVTPAGGVGKTWQAVNATKCVFYGKLDGSDAVSTTNGTSFTPLTVTGVDGVIGPVTWFAAASLWCMLAGSTDEDSEGIYTSADGEAFTLRQLDGDLTNIAASATQAIAVGGGASFTTDDGLVWAAGGAVESDGQFLLADAGTGQFIADAAGTANTVRFTADGGATWATYDAGSEAWLDVAPDVAVVLGATGRVLFTDGDDVVVLRATSGPVGPQNVVAVTGNPVVVTWDPVDDADGYVVLRGPTALGPFTQLTPDCIPETTYEDETAPLGVPQYYVVRAACIPEPVPDSAPSDPAVRFVLGMAPTALTLRADAGLNDFVPRTVAARAPRLWRTRNTRATGLVDFSAAPLFSLAEERLETLDGELLETL